MSRIISDTYVKQNKQIWGEDPNTEFNRKILSVNNMYGWLYEKGILEKTSFVFKDYEGTAYFAVNAKDLLPYREQMEKAEIGGAALAVQHIFDEPYTPCIYSGAIELGWTMRSYRSVDGCVGSSWECGLIQCLNIDGIYKIAEIKDELGVKAAVCALYDQFDWNLTLPEQARYQEALEHFNAEAHINIENDYVKKHGRELIYCYENKKNLLDFDFWTRYEDICKDKLTFDEYIAIDRSFDGDPLEIEPTNQEVAAKLKENLESYRDSVKHKTPEEPMGTQSKDSFRSLDHLIASASSNPGKINAVPDTKHKDPER